MPVCASVFLCVRAFVPEFGSRGHVIQHSQEGDMDQIIHLGAWVGRKTRIPSNGHGYCGVSI